VRLFVHILMHRRASVLDLWSLLIKANMQGLSGLLTLCDSPQVLNAGFVWCW
jgi:hypothetical protein